MNLKDIIQQDLDDVFFDENGLGEKVNFSGFEIIVIKSVQAYKDKYLKYSSGERETGTYKNGIALTIRQTDLKVVPEPGDEVEVDGIIMFVADIDIIGTFTYRIFLERIDG